MLSRLGKKLIALVSRDTVAAAPTAHATTLGEPSRLVPSDAEQNSTVRSEPEPNTAATEKQQDVQPVPVLMWENPSSQLDVTERKAPKAGQTDAAEAKGTDKAPDGRLEAETASDDDLTVLKLGSAIDEWPHEKLFEFLESFSRSVGRSHVGSNRSCRQLTSGISQHVNQSR